ncbi:type II secretion system protein [Vibrio sp. TBV020]|uniref:type II secretion system protein n=1 Tax=Vibrio sp. TBV020 TaxID=3137398 RepID=UPI0038CD45D3
MKTQRGFGLIEIVLGVALLSSVALVVVPFLLEQQKDRHAIAYADHIKNVISRLHQYQYYKVSEERIPATDSRSWPSTLNGLMTDYPKRYWNECSTAQEANNECVRPDFVPWASTRIDSHTQTDTTTAPHYSHMVLTLPLSSLVADTKEYLRWSVPLMTIPGARKTATQDIEIILRQATSALIYDGLVLRTGDKALTDDWDVGNQSILGVQDLYINNSDGSTTSVAQGLVSVYSVKQWEKLEKPGCPQGLAPEVSLSVGAINVISPYTLIGSIKPYIANETSTHWTFNIDAYVLNTQTNKYQVLSNGDIVAMVQCR